MRRIFWFGMHKVLKTTELPYLRSLGFEVFNPPYVSAVYDQSADRRIDGDQPTTLPREVFDKLLSHNFFYSEVPPEIAELLNTYFDVAIVTINLGWLNSFLKTFRGQIIYRLYGQHFSLSELILEQRLWPALVGRPNFTIVPFTAESVEREQQWFLDLCTDPVPYQIPDDVFARSGSWDCHERKRHIGTAIPNIENAYYAEAYAAFDRDFPHRIFRIFGPQRSVPPDERIVGALQRGEFLDSLRACSAFLYNYRDQVCYLSPVEMMEMGGPVIYAPGSLLSRFYRGATPGLYRNRREAEGLIRRLLGGDRGLIGEILAAQERVRALYDRKIVRPIFDRIFGDLLEEGIVRPPLLRSAGGWTRPSHAPAAIRSRRRIAILLHVDGLFGYSNGRAYAFEGIPRVVDAVVNALSFDGDLNFIVTCTRASQPIVYDFFHKQVAGGRMELRVVDMHDHPEGLSARHERLWLVEDLNALTDLVCTLVPHYYLFPEALLLSGPIVLYLPDYFPHLMPGAVFDVSVEKDQENKEVGVAIARKARAVLTNSDYTRNYLPAAGFVEGDESEKIVVAPLPLLGGRHDGDLTPEQETWLGERIAGRRFLFYPTANRPNKQVAFLLRLFAVMRLLYPDLILVLTGELDTVPGTREVADRYRLHEHLVTMSRVGDDVLGWLYRHAVALCLTSTSEGNFPPQVLEALSYQTPVVATRLPTITEVLGENGGGMLLCSPLRLDEFREKLELAINRRDQVVAGQEAVLKLLRERSAPDKFRAKLERALLASPADIERAA